MKQLFIALVVAATSAAAVTDTPAANQAAPDNPLQKSQSWIELRDDLAGNAVLNDATGLFDVVAPYRAHDAATVPIQIRQAATGTDRITGAMVVIDENPAPMAAEMTFGEAMSPLDFALRVRVDQYSNVRVIARTARGSFMQGRFVKASGGCSAPASRSSEQALASMGRMRLKHFGEAAARSGGHREAQIMIRHPNYSGLQRDQITQLFVGAHFIHQLEVFQGDEMLFTLQGGISISENPVFRFTYRDNGAPAFRVRAEDTEGNVFEKVLKKDIQS